MENNIQEALKKFLEELNKKIIDISSIKKQAESYAKNAVAEEKTKIFNEGIATGKQLLVQLNNGEITLGDFDQKINYNSL
jgi:23S rRNA pseudoU1915 N3-methylase RlmH